MRRREVIALLGVALAPASAARGQPSLPVIGFLRNSSPDGSAPFLAAFRKGLVETGYSEGRNLLIEYRWTGGETDRLPAMAADLVDRQVSVIVALGNTPGVRAAKAATATIPIVFMVGPDPVELGLVASLNRPGGNLTGVVNLNQQIARKWVEVLHELVPKATTLALLVNPANAESTKHYTREVQEAIRTLGLHLHVAQATSGGDFDAVFAGLREVRAGALVIVADALFISQMEKLAALALRERIPSLYPFREFVVAGGLASYGTDLLDAYRLGGVYAGRILRGENPADMPVQQATKVEMLINLKTAQALGLAIPPTLLARADEVIE